MSTDEIKLALLLGACALLGAVHIVTVIGLMGKPEPKHGLLALVLPPAAPVLAWRRGTRVRAVLWATFAALYIVMFVLAR